MTTTDPTPEDEIILEPGDPGYVDPDHPEEADPNAIDPNQPVLEPAGAEGSGAPAPPGRNMEHQRNVGETEAEFMSRTRNVVVDSQSPSDIVPNTPQIRPFPVEVEPEFPPEFQPEGEVVEQESSPQQGETTSEGGTPITSETPVLITPTETETTEERPA